jgi:hypothetical protein
VSTPRIITIDKNNWLVVETVADLRDHESWRLYVVSERAKRFREAVQIMQDVPGLCKCDHVRRSVRTVAHKLAGNPAWSDGICMDMDHAHIIDGTTRAAVLFHWGCKIPANLVRFHSNINGVLTDGS